MFKNICRDKLSHASLRLKKDLSAVLKKCPVQIILNFTNFFKEQIIDQEATSEDDDITQAVII